MWRNYSLLLAVSSFYVSPALADLVGVTFTGNADFAGSVIARCLPGSSCYAQGYDVDSESLSSGYTNNNQDNFTSSSGTITAADRVTMSGSVQQITDVSPTSFSVDLETLVTLDSIGHEWGASADIANSYFLNFTLTTESVMHLSEPLNVGNSPAQDQCDLRSADEKTYIPLPCFDDGSFDQSFTLGPGTYFLSLADQLISGEFFDVDGHSVTTDHLVLTADFTSIPEPRWGVFLLASLLVVVSGYAPLRRHGRA